MQDEYVYAGIDWVSRRLVNVCSARHHVETLMVTANCDPTVVPCVRGSGVEEDGEQLVSNDSSGCRDM